MTYRSKCATGGVITNRIKRRRAIVTAKQNNDPVPDDDRKVLEAMAELPGGRHRRAKPLDLCSAGFSAMTTKEDR